MTHIQFYKNSTNDIIYLNGDTSYMRKYALLPWVGTSNCIDDHAHGGYFAYEDIVKTTPDLLQYTQYILW